MATTEIPVTGDPAADRLLVQSPLALLVGMLLDQQVPMQWAFKGPHTLSERLGGLDAAAIAAMDPEELEAVFREKPALHRYPASMAKRTHALCQVLVDEYDGNAASVWKVAPAGEPRDETGDDLLARLRALPGFGEEKSKIFLALLAKRFAVTPPGWEAAAKPFSDATKRSVADIDSSEALAEVLTWKKAQKAKGKGKAD
ncbi:MAG: Fe-S cluster assembly protein HesB [Acidimicrobiia bacterium]|nr:Fe-S cluster assembly protein HesB [Acidimicrobiia bacterium]